MENQREICLAEFNKSRIENTPMNWHIWKRAYDRGAANEATYYSDIHNVRVSLAGEALECNYVDRKAKECLTNGKKYIVLADNERRGFKIKDDKNKTKWYRTFCYFRKPDSL